MLGEGRIVPGGHNHDLFNENDNNNGPISPADLENIENNNAGEYIPNLNQILAPVVEAPVMQQPPPLLMQHQPLVFAPHSHLPLHINEVQGQANVSNSSFSDPVFPVANSRGPTSLDMITINMPNDTNPFLDESESDMIVHLNDIRIDVEEECCTEVPLLGTRVSAIPSNRGIQSIFGISASRSVVEEEDPSEELAQNEAQDDDSEWDRNENSTNSKNEDQHVSKYNAGVISSEEARGVEEALLALDFAISGAEGQSDEDDSETEFDVENEPLEDMLPNSKHVDTSSDNETPIVEDTNVVYDLELIDDVTQTANELIESLLEESLRKVYEHLDEKSGEVLTVNTQVNDNTIVITNTSLSELLPMDLSNLSSDHDVSSDSLIDFNLEQLAIEASTPFIHKQMVVDSTFTSTDIRPKRAAQSLFGIDPQTNADAELNQSWCLPIVGNTSFDETASIVVEPTKVANGTFTANSNELTFITAKTNDATFVATDQTFVAAKETTFTATDQTFTAPTTNDQTYVESPKKTHTNLPEIRISTDSDVASVDLTTATPVNTPIELNYTVDGWDTFITNSMKKPLQLGHNDDLAQPSTSTSLKPDSGHGIFATPLDAPGPSGDATFAMDANSSNGWSNDDDGMLDDADDDQCEDGALLSLTFDSLRKQLTEALPHAQGSMSCSGPSDLADDIADVSDELMNNDFDLENR